jgi:hypothetical protein
MFDIHQSVYDKHEELDSRLVEKYITGLITEFVNSPEAKELGEEWSAWPEMFLHHALDYLGTPPAEMSLSDFREVVYELFPRKVSTEPASAGEIITELRAFWKFLHRQYGLENAPRILADLGDEAIADLREELANPANYGMAKSFFMMGSEAGFDMRTQEGLDEFTAAYNAGLAGGLPDDLPDNLPEVPPLFPPSLGWGPPPVPREQREAKRKQRKRERKARKRNRR